MKKLFIFLLLFTVFMALVCHAQTNGVSTNSVPAPEVIQVTDAESALMALLHFLGVSPMGVTVFTIVLHLGCRAVRNTALEGKLSQECGGVANFIALVAAKPLPMMATASLSTQIIQSADALLPHPAAAPLPPVAGSK